MQSTDLSRSQNDSVFLMFNGTGITVYGSKNSDHGMYAIQLDGMNMTTSDGYSATPSFQQILYSVDNLSSTQVHTLIITNVPSPAEVGSNSTKSSFELDFAVIKTATTGTIYTSIIDDASSVITYTGSNWVRGTPSDDYYGTTRMVSKDSGDFMKFSFSGTSAELYGAVNWDHGNYSVIIDGIQSQNNIFNGSFYGLRPKTSLFMINNLPEGHHEIIVTNLGQGAKGNYFDFDYAVINSTVAPSSSTPTNDVAPIASTTIDSSSSSSSSDSSNSSSTGSSSNHVAAIAGGAVGAIVGLALVIVLACFLFRRKKDTQVDGDRYMSRKDSKVDLNGEEVKPYHSGFNLDSTSAYLDPRPAGAPFYTTSGQSPSASITARETDQTSLPFLTAIPPPPDAQATSYPASTVNRSNTMHSHGPPSTDISHNTFGVPISRGRGGPPFPHSEGIAEAEETPQAPIPIKPGMTLPGRYQVEGREQDLGPYIPDEEAYQVQGTLPPDYRQATQPP
ncbi:hypothetical protein I204_01247 [Kwoniella mangroviensis CBS 8886]|nr:hypothetical protein I204_01247 [Kwoniella mangroviensis CBS 8886]